MIGYLNSYKRLREENFSGTDQGKLFDGIIEGMDVLCYADGQVEFMPVGDDFQPHHTHKFCVTYFHELLHERLEKAGYRKVDKINTWECRCGLPHKINTACRTCKQAEVVDPWDLEWSEVTPAEPGKHIPEAE